MLAALKPKPASSVTVAALEARAAEVQARLDAAHITYASAALVAEDNPVPDALRARDSARQAIAKDEAALADIHAALTGARDRETAAAKAEAAAAVKKAWKRTAELAAERAQAAADVEAAVAVLAEKFNRLVDLGKELHAAAPEKDDKHLSQSLLAPSVVTGWLQIELKRQGFSFACRFVPWPVPVFVEKIQAGNDVILSRRPK